MPLILCINKWKGLYKAPSAHRERYYIFIFQVLFPTESWEVEMSEWHCRPCVNRFVDFMKKSDIIIIRIFTRAAMKAVVLTLLLLAVSVYLWTLYTGNGECYEGLLIAWWNTILWGEEMFWGNTWVIKSLLGTKIGITYVWHQKHRFCTYFTVLERLVIAKGIHVFDTLQ